MQKKAYLTKLTYLVLAHLLLITAASFVFFLDDSSWMYQSLLSTIHLSFALAVGLFVAKGESFSSQARLIGLISVAAFALLNLIPSQQGMNSHENGFVDLWLLAPQLKWGWPHVYARVIDASVPDWDIYKGEFRVYANLFFFNLYLLVVGLAAGLRLVDMIRAKFKRDQ